VSIKEEKKNQILSVAPLTVYYRFDEEASSPGLYPLKNFVPILVADRPFCN